MQDRAGKCSSWVRSVGEGVGLTERHGWVQRACAGGFLRAHFTAAAAAARLVKLSKQADQMGCTRSVISLCRLRVSVSTVADM